MDTAGAADTMTQVKTHSVTKLKLAVATLAAVAAGSAALATVPMRGPSSTILTVTSCLAVTGGVATERQYLNSCTAGKNYTYVCTSDNTFRLIWRAPCVGAPTSNSFSDFYVNGSCRQLSNGIALTETFNNGCTGANNYTYSCDNRTRMRKTMSACTLTSPFCVDGDFGANLVSRSVTGMWSPSLRRYVSSTQDVCVSTTTVREGQSLSGSPTLTSMLCTPSSSCSDGRCVFGGTTKCIDVDGTDSHISSTAKVISLTDGRIVTSLADSCYVGLNAVGEAVCDGGNNISYVTSTCAAGEQCADGACRPASCVDGDGGFVETVSSSVTMMVGGKVTGVYNDACVVSSTPLPDSDYTVVSTSYQIMEQTCNGLNASSTVKFCSSGTKCLYGACVPLRYACSDSDGGDVPAVRGSVTVTDLLIGNIISTQTDRCQVISGVNKLQENYCQSATSSWSTYRWVTCPSGNSCSDGACVTTTTSTSSLTCFDGDGGQNFYTFGTTTLKNGPVTVQFEQDICLATTTLREYYCGTGVILSTSTYCNSGCNGFGRCN